MKLNRVMLLGTAATVTAAALALGYVNVVGFDRYAAPDAQSAGTEQAAAEQADSVAEDATETTSAAGDLGVEQDARGGGAHGGAAHGGAARGGAAHGGGARGGYGFEHGVGRGGYGRAGYGHGYGRGGWGDGRWGRWGGGRWVDGRWAAGPYYGWCNDRYYSCRRAWW
jgi:hypothetical protein